MDFPVSPYVTPALSGGPNDQRPHTMSSNRRAQIFVQVAPGRIYPSTSANFHSRFHRFRRFSRAMAYSASPYGSNQTNWVIA